MNPLEYLIAFLILIPTSFRSDQKTYGKEKEIKTKLSIFEFISREKKDSEIERYLKLNNDKPFSEKQKEAFTIYTIFLNHWKIKNMTLHY